MQVNSFRRLMESLAVAVVLTVFTYAVALYKGWVPIPVDWLRDPRWLEIFAVFTSYSCTYMCVFQTRWNYPMGFISSIAYATLFYQDKYFGSAFVTVYLLAAIAYGFWRWGPDGNTRPVKFVGISYWWLGYAALVTVGYGIATAILEYNGATLPTFDAFIFAATILAQFLMDNKKLEAWAVWAAINVAAIYTYSETLPLVAFQYVFFLANTVWAATQWFKSMREYNSTFGRQAAE